MILYMAFEDTIAYKCHALHDEKNLSTYNFLQCLCINSPWWMIIKWTTEIALNKHNKFGIASYVTISTKPGYIYLLKIISKKFKLMLFHHYFLL